MRRKGQVLETGYAGWVKAIPLLMAFVLVYVAPTSVSEWQAGGIVAQMATLAGVLGCLGCTVEIWVRRTRLLETHIEHRGYFGFTSIHEYRDISEVSTNGEALRLRFRDGQSVRIWAREANLGAVKDVVARRLAQTGPSSG